MPQAIVEAARSFAINSPAPGMPKRMAKGDRRTMSLAAARELHKQGLVTEPRLIEGRKPEHAAPGTDELERLREVADLAQSRLERIKSELARTAARASESRRAAPDPDKPEGIHETELELLVAERSQEKLSNASREAARNVATARRAYNLALYRRLRSDAERTVESDLRPRVGRVAADLSEVIGRCLSAWAEVDRVAIELGERARVRNLDAMDLWTEELGRAMYQTAPKAG